MNIKKLRSSILLALCAAPCFFTHNAAAETEKVVLEVPNMAFPFFAFMRDQANDEAKKQSIDLVVGDGQGQSPKQSSDVRNAINQGVNGIVLVPNDVNALVPVVNEVLQGNIPIITVDRTVTGTDKPVPHVGADNVAGGREMAKFIESRFPDGCKMIFLRGEPGASPAIDRAKGFYEVIKAAGDKYKVLADQTAYFHRDQGMTVTQNLLTSLGTPPDAIVSSNDDMAMGAVEALQQAGLPKGKVVVVGYDALPEALSKIRSGEMAATIEQSPGKQVRTAMDELVGFLRDKKPMQDTVIQPFVVSKDNLDKAERIGEAK
jgi:inositol transport system substrate-binding protein